MGGVPSYHLLVSQDFSGLLGFCSRESRPLSFYSVAVQRLRNILLGPQTPAGLLGFELDEADVATGFSELISVISVPLPTGKTDQIPHDTTGPDTYFANYEHASTPTIAGFGEEFRRFPKIRCRCPLVKRTKFLMNPPDLTHISPTTSMQALLPLGVSARNSMKFPKTRCRYPLVKRTEIVENHENQRYRSRKNLSPRNRQAERNLEKSVPFFVLRSYGEPSRSPFFILLETVLRVCRRHWDSFEDKIWDRFEDIVGGYVMYAPFLTRAFGARSSGA